MTGFRKGGMKYVQNGKLLIHYGLLLAMTVALSGPALAESLQNRQPDIVFILLDDLRWDGLSYMDHPYVKTPHIDRLREQGASMENAFVTTSMCCPSRATFLTGTYASRHGVIDNETSEYNPDITPPVSKYLQQAGYTTALIGKWHMGNSAHPRPYFDYWLSFKSQGTYFDPLLNINGEKVQLKGYTTDLLTDKAIDFIREHPLDKPYFCMLSHKAVHQPFKPAPRHTEAFGADTIDLRPKSWDDTFLGKPEWLRRDQVRSWRWDWRTRDIEAETVPESFPLIPYGEYQHYINQYRCLAAVDDGVGRILQTLEQRGTLDNTLIIFTSDNGYFHNEHRRWDKRLAYEESLRIPMVIAYPGHIKPGSSVSEMVSNLDFAPTVLGFAGIPVPEQMQGLDLRPLFNPSAPEGSDATSWRNHIFYEYWVDLSHSVPTMIAVRTDRYKLIQYPEIDDIDELYDLEKDPYEMSNLAENPEFAGLHGKMEELLKESAREAGWRPDIFPKNLPRFRGPKGILKEVIRDRTVSFEDESDIITVPFDESMDPSGWPYRIDIEVKAESDGVIVSQAGDLYGFKIFIQDGRPGVSTICKTWKASQTTIDGPESILGKWTRLQAVIDYNRQTFAVNGQVIDRIALPQPFKEPTGAPLFVGRGSQNPVVNETPNNAFQGSIRKLILRRDFLETD
jgi:N-acetylglucosamine-6-sulfatase